MRPAILVFDDHPLIFAGLRLELGEHHDLYHAPTPAALTEQLAARHFELVIVDLQLKGGACGLDYLNPIRNHGAKILILTATDDEVLLRRCVQAEVDGLLEKNDSTTTPATVVQWVLAGHRLEHGLLRRVVADEGNRIPTMSQREQDALNCICRDPGIGQKQLADQLGVSPSRAGMLVATLGEKFGVDGAPRIAREAERRGWGKHKWAH